MVKVIKEEVMAEVINASPLSKDSVWVCETLAKVLLKFWPDYHFRSVEVEEAKNKLSATFDQREMRNEVLCNNPKEIYLDVGPTFWITVEFFVAPGIKAMKDMCSCCHCLSFTNWLRTPHYVQLNNGRQMRFQFIFYDRLDHPDSLKAGDERREAKRQAFYKYGYNWRKYVNIR